MSIKGRIRALQIVISVVVTAMAAIVLIVLEASDHRLDRAEHSRRQLSAINQLAIDANRYSEQIAELLLIGEPERPDFNSARLQVSRALADLRRTTEQEASVLRSQQERDEELVETERLDRMTVLFREIDRAVERLLVLAGEGRRDEAIALFRSTIENQLDAEFAQLISDTRTDELDEVRRIEADLVRLAREVELTTLAASTLLLIVALLAGFLFARSIERPINALRAGALAIEGGDLDHRIRHSGGDELAVLSQRFNAMAEQLGRQRATILEAQQGLERQVADRTNQLADANRQLVATDHQRVRFLTDISHELRTPLTALRGEAEVALRGASKPATEYRQALTNVVARAEDLARLVDDLLFLARSESDDIQFQMQEVKLHDVIGKAVAEAGVLGRGRKVRLELVCSRQDLGIRADPRRLQQAVLIVLDNAVRYADAGTVVEIAVGGDDTAAELSIRDRGKGIATEDVTHVFDRFLRGGNARDQWSGGTGLGLPIARWIVEKHGGTIRLASSVGVGTEVVMRFPVSG